MSKPDAHRDRCRRHRQRSREFPNRQRCRQHPVGPRRQRHDPRAGGNDSLFGGLGDDRLHGAAGETLRMAARATTSTWSTVSATARSRMPRKEPTLPQGISFKLGANLENLVLTDAAVRGEGNSLANAITGNELANMLLGLAGKDSLLGEEGNDNLRGGRGIDELVGDSVWTSRAMGVGTPSSSTPRRAAVSTRSGIRCRQGFVLARQGHLCRDRQQARQGRVRNRQEGRRRQRPHHLRRGHRQALLRRERQRRRRQAPVCQARQGSGPRSHGLHDDRRLRGVGAGERSMRGALRGRRE